MSYLLSTKHNFSKLFGWLFTIGLLFSMLPAFAVTNRLGGLSTRSYVGTEPANYLIAGVLINVSPKKVVIRASSVDGVLNPKLSIKTYPAGTTIYSNNDWISGASSAELQQIDGGKWKPARTTDAALIVTLNPGLYTAEVAPESVAGVGIVEVYELDGNTGNVKLGGISTRSLVGTDPNNYMIAGLLVQGEPKRLILRAVSVDGVFNPKIEVKTYPDAISIASNSDWGSGTSAVELQQLGGAWTPAKSQDAALVSVLNPGLYTLEVSPQNGVPGVGLVEVYEQPNYPGNGETAPSTGTGNTTTEPAAFSGIVAAHNAWRNQVGVAGLTWSNTLATYAQQWADTLKSQNCAMQHRTNNQYGENLYWSYGSNPTTQQVVDTWGNEVTYYNYSTNTCATGKVCGHYTQVVWKNTTEVGCGKAACGSAQIWVCNYNPAGNYIGQKPY